MTAWTQAVEDEHRLLSQLLTILFSTRACRPTRCQGRLSNGSQRYPILGRVGQAKGEGKADFWNAVGGQYKASLDYVVTLSCEAGAVVRARPGGRRADRQRAPTLGGPPGTITELHRVGGRVVDADGEPSPTPG